MRFFCRTRAIVCYLMLSASLFAAQIKGTATNGTNGKPAVGDEVILFSLTGGMQETSRGRTDSQGHFSLDAPDEGAQHLIRVVHQGVNYHGMAPAGTNNVDITVYEAAAQVENIIGEGHVFRFQTANGQLDVSEAFTLRNESKPPRTKMGKHSFEFSLPEGAQLEEGMARGPGSMPLTSSPEPTGPKNRYGFVFPLRPGQTQFQVTYKLPYKGSQEFTVVPDVPMAELGVMLPRSMNFKSTGESFARATDESGMTVYVAKSVSKGQKLAFTVLGEGTAPSEAQGGGGGGGEAPRPGGGLGAPIDAPSPLGNARWYIIGGLMVVFGGGAFWVLHKRTAHANQPEVQTAASTRPSPPLPQKAAKTAAGSAPPSAAA
ncbi:MAG TPA: carboxypeptidase regulatory-like domain-containing protein, partial [Alphaproteobacteria bacterium]|nr:carboxypeptidase regulatory-like domain-containing protein [Alphaproteobacteria bacterium]